MVARQEINVLGITAANFDSMMAGMPEGTLTRTIEGTRDPDKPSSRSTSVETHKFRGFIEKGVMRMTDNQTPEYVTVINIFGRSLLIEPEVNDQVEIHGESYTLTGFHSKLDPVRTLYRFVGN